MTILLAFAEILLWDTRVLPPHEITHSVRIQLSDQRDLSRHGNVVIPHEGHSLCAVKARTVLPSGAEISVSPSPLLDDGSIVFPALEPGSIIEYQ